MPNSMTGYGRGEISDSELSCIAEIRSVNHRFRDVFLRVPRELGIFEDRIRGLMAEHFDRGRIEVSVTLEETGESLTDIKINHELVKSYTLVTRRLAENLKLPWNLDIQSLILLPGVIESTRKQIDNERIWSLVEQSVLSAIQELKSMRAKEGAFLAEDIINRVNLIESLVLDIEKRAPCIFEDYRIKLKARIQELLEDTPIDENRIAMETAIYADKSNITEELVRLRSHVIQVHETVKLHGPIGRRLGFLTQEMQREVNTIGSKAQDPDVSHMVVSIKSELEKIREQVQNIE
ncbi:MAG: YicC family protein [Firmicutes bacterium]|jgi:uncharacterized protein (TIGR00255 family)|nr:YicC family protein [Bacillota bacterium]